MRKKPLILMAIAIATGLLLFGCGSDGTSPGSDLVILNAAVFTSDGENPWAQAVAVSDGRRRRHSHGYQRL